MDQLSPSIVGRLVYLVSSGIVREYPNKTGHVVTDSADCRSPQELHPIFFGCFDWHSSVHSHWTLIRLLRLFPDSNFAKSTRFLLESSFTNDRLAAEAAYFDAPENRLFERMYGWAWVLRLAAELTDWDDPTAETMRSAFTPLEDTIVNLTTDYLPRLRNPIRTGVHPDTGFALSQILDYARSVGNSDLQALVEQRARAYYFDDRDYPLDYEPSGEDFFSSGLNEADCMRRVLSPDEFATWLSGFFPGLDESDRRWFAPVTADQPTDGRIAHLAGLNLSRAWTMRGIASVLPERDPRIKVLIQSADEHSKSLVSDVFSGHYEGEHWLGTFAVYLLTGAGIVSQ